MNEVSQEKLDKVIEQIRHLQSKVGANATIEEVNTALGVADRLMEKYRITQAQVDAKNNTKQSFEKNVLATLSKRSQWQEIILDALCKTYSATWYMQDIGNRQTQYVVVAFSDDYTIIEYFFMGYLIEEIERLADLHCAGQGHTYAHSWRIGCANAVAAKFSAIRKERADELKHAQMGEASQETCTAMVLLSRRGDEAEEWKKAEALRFYCRHCGFSCNHHDEANWKVIQTTSEITGKPWCPKCKKPGKIKGLTCAASLTGARDRSGYSDGAKVGAGVNIRMGIGGGGKGTQQLG